MQDITEHIKGLMDISKGISILESEEFTKEVMESINSGSVNEGNIPKDLNDLPNFSPIGRRKAALEFLQTLLKKMGRDVNSLGYKDMGLWNITTYVPFILKTEFKNKERAVKIFSPILKAVEDLKDYSDEVNNMRNTLHTKSGIIDKANALSVVKDESINRWLMSEDADEFTTMGLMMWSEGIGYDLKDDAELEKVLKLINPMKKFYRNFETTFSKSGRDLVIITGNSKNYDKLVNKYLKTVVKKIEAENK